MQFCSRNKELVRIYLVTPDGFTDEAQIYKLIVVAVDGGSTVERALQEAIKLASELGARLRLVNEIDTTNGRGSSQPAGMSETVVKTGQEILDKATAVARVQVSPSRLI